MARSSFPDAGSAALAVDLVAVIRENAAYLSEVDGAIGDGDHGINMRKGFELFGAAAAAKDVKDASAAFLLLGSTLLEGIGGSMGPLYGSLFKAFGRAIRGRIVDAAAFLAMLQAGEGAVTTIGEARPGDKTMLDALDPAIKAFNACHSAGGDFIACLDAMASAARAGADATTDMIARVGRASRLGERSRGVRDAGATSCAIILSRIAESATRLLHIES
jgi:dihydroxyacetone kinase phosphoprotein-dependent L subunit